MKVLLTPRSPLKTEGGRGEGIRFLTSEYMLLTLTRKVSNRVHNKKFQTVRLITAWLQGIAIRSAMAAQMPSRGIKLTKLSYSARG
jgi:hypothetical protein